MPWTLLGQAEGVIVPGSAVTRLTQAHSGVRGTRSVNVTGVGCLTASGVVEFSPVSA